MVFTIPVVYTEFGVPTDVEFQMYDTYKYLWCLIHTATIKKWRNLLQQESAASEWNNNTIRAKVLVLDVGVQGQYAPGLEVWKQASGLGGARPWFNVQTCEARSGHFRRRWERTMSSSCWDNPSNAHRSDRQFSNPTTIVQSWLGLLRLRRIGRIFWIQV